MSSGNGFDDPIAYLVGILVLGLVAFTLVFVAAIFAIPVIAAGLALYLTYMHFETKRIRVRIPLSPPSAPDLPEVTVPDSLRVEAFASSIENTLLKYAERNNERQSCQQLSQAFTQVVCDLYKQESFDVPPQRPQTNELISKAAYFDLLEKWEKKTTPESIDVFTKIATAFYSELSDYFPPAAFEKTSSFTVPLSISMTPTQLTELGAWFFVPEAETNQLFEGMRRQILANDEEISKSKNDPSFDALFADTPIANFSGTHIPFDIPDSRMMEHCVIVAGAGTGKTQTLGALIAGYLMRDDPPAMVVVDSTGALIRKIQTLALFNDRLKDRIVIIDPELTPVPALNMFDISNPRLQGYSATMKASIETEIVALFNYIFTSAANDLTSRQGTVFSYVVRLALSIPNANMTTLLAILEEPAKTFATSRYRQNIEALDTTAQEFFKNQYFELKGFRDQIAQRVHSLVQVPAFRDMFATSNRVDFYDELQNKGSIILVNTSEMLLKENASPLFGRYVIARTMASAFERAAIPERDRRPTILFIDECAPYVDDTFDKLLTRLRQFKLGVCAAFQHMEQVSEKLKSSIASNTSVKLAAGLGYADSRWLARDMEAAPEFLKAQRRDGNEPPQWTQMACFVRNYTPKAVSLTIPFYQLENMPQMTTTQHAAMLQRNKVRVSGTVDVPSEKPIGPRLNPRPEAMEPWRLNPDKPTSKPDDDGAGNWK